MCARGRGWRRAATAAGDARGLPMETIYEERSGGVGTAKISHRRNGGGKPEEGNSGGRAYRGRDAADSEDSSSSTASDVFDAGLDASETSVIVVSNVLPLDISFDKKAQQWSASWSRDVDGTGWSGNTAWDALGFRRVVHVGVPNAYVPTDQRDKVEKLLNQFDCVPVYLEAQEAHEHYQGWCKAVIWPVFHNIIDLYNASKVETRSSNTRRQSLSGPSSSSASESEQDAAAAGTGGGGGQHSMQSKEKERSEWVPQKSWHPFMQEQAWPAHKAVIAKFARVVSQTHSEGDVVWIQDYHLLLLPSFVVRKLPRANIGMFLHVPFPSSEIFRTLSFREEILRSMLCSDHVGFHQFEYAR